MTRFPRVLSIWVTAVAGVLGFAFQAAAAPLAPDPQMPSGWRIMSNQTFGPDSIRPVAARLGANVTALRNVLYRVEGQNVTVNVIVTGTAADADKVMASLRRMKSEEFMLRDGLTIFEFVGTDAAIPQIRAGRAHLQRARGRT